MSQPIKVPDIGGAEAVEVIEINVAVGDQVEEEQTLIVLESDKATMEIPAPEAGVIGAIHLSVGDKVQEGSLICDLEAGASGGSSSSETTGSLTTESESTSTNDNPASGSAAASAPSSQSQESLVTVPDLGGSDSVEIIEIAVQVGDQVEPEQSLIVLESDKATMDIPAPMGGEVLSISVQVGDKVSEGNAILTLKTAGAGASSAPGAAKPQVPSPSAPPAPAGTPTPEGKTAPAGTSAPTEKTAPAETTAPSSAPGIHAGPAVRKLARELGVNLTEVKGSGPKGRIQKDDLHAYVKAKVQAPATGHSGGLGIPEMPKVDFSKFGNIERVALNKLRKVSARNLHRSWLNVPHVTQFDEADITDLEAFRKNAVPKMAPEGVKVTPLAFMLKACAHALKHFPKFNASLDTDGEHLILKEYVNIGVAVETPDGLVVPVLRHVDQKSVFELAKECSDIAKKARDKKLPLDAMQGGNFSISSLGGIGGTAFTPIVNAPEVAILGVSKAQMKPIWDGNAFQPRLMLPLCLSYDHRVIDGADAARFTAYLASLLTDVRRILL